MLIETGYFLIHTKFRTKSSEVIVSTPSMQLVKEIDGKSTRYSSSRGASILGAHLKSGNYHIFSISNNGDPRTSISDLSVLFKILQDDLRSLGVKRITTKCANELVPIAIKRYGFRPIERIRLDQNTVSRNRAKDLLRRRNVHFTTALYKNI